MSVYGDRLEITATVYLSQSEYPEYRLVKTVYNLMDFKLQFFFITEVDERLYPSRSLLESTNPKIAAYAELWELNVNQSLIGKSRVLWERLMNLVYYLETGRSLEGRASKKAKFFKFVEGHDKWQFLAAYKDAVTTHDDGLRTPEYHKASVLRSVLMGNKKIEFSNYRELYGNLLNTFWENFSSITAGGKATHRTSVHLDEDGNLKDEYKFD